MRIPPHRTTDTKATPYFLMTSTHPAALLFRLGNTSRFLPQLVSGIPLGAGSCARCVYEECDPILEALLTRCIYQRDFQPVAAYTEIGR
jgi:hypothetical protein